MMREHPSEGHQGRSMHLIFFTSPVFYRSSIGKHLYNMFVCVLWTCGDVYMAFLTYGMPFFDRPINKASGMQSRDDDFDLAEFSQ